MGRTLGNSLVNLGLLDECAQGAARARLPPRGPARGGVGRRPRQRRPRPAGRLLPRLAGHARLPVLRLRPPLRLRHLPPAHRRTAPRSRCPTAGCATATRGRSPRTGDRFRVQFYGRVARVRRTRAGRLTNEWVDTQDVLATPYDTPDPRLRQRDRQHAAALGGAGRRASSTSASSTRATTSAPSRRGPESENICRVLYPNDNVLAGQELRLTQEYFFVSATLQDIIRRYKKRYQHVRRAAGPRHLRPLRRARSPSSSTTRTPPWPSPS